MEKNSMRRTALGFVLIEPSTLRLPDPAVVTLIIRQGNTFVPLPDTRIEPGDELMIVTTSKTRALTESRLRAVSRRGKLAYWFDEYGDVG